MSRRVGLDGARSTESPTVVPTVPKASGRAISRNSSALARAGGGLHPAEGLQTLLIVELALKERPVEIVKRQQEGVRGSVPCEGAVHDGLFMVLPEESRVLVGPPGACSDR